MSSSVADARRRLCCSSVAELMTEVDSMSVSHANVDLAPGTLVNAHYSLISDITSSIKNTYLLSDNTFGIILLVTWAGQQQLIWH